jgi:hypothetical protein
VTWLGSTVHPMAFPMPALVGIADTNALAARACNAASRFLTEDLFTGLARHGALQHLRECACPRRTG